MFERVRQGAVDVIRGDEALVADNLPRPAQLLDACFAGGIPRVVLDLEGVPLMDGKGLEWVLDTHERLLDRGSGLRIVVNQSLCREILQLTGVAEQCQVYGDLTSAVASFIQ
jgi:anti-anti-sigma factor